MNSRPLRRTVVPAAISGLAAVTLVACSSSSGPNGGDAGSDGKNLTSVSINAGWPTTVPYFTPVLVAQKQGFFARHGLHVSIDNGSGSQTALQAVATGKDLLAWADLTTTAAAISAKLPIKAVADVQPKGDYAVVSLAKTNITKPSDLKGKHVGSTPSGSDATMLPALLGTNSMSKGDVTVDSLPGDSKLGALLAGKVDAISGQGYYYASLIKSKGGDPRELLAANFNANVIGHGWVANAKVSAQDGPRITEFLAAYHEALDATFKDVKAACKIFLDSGVVGYTASLCEDQLNGWHELLTDPAVDGKPWGYNADSLWQQSLDVLVKYQNVTALSLPTYYTNAYLPKS